MFVDTRGIYLRIMLHISYANQAEQNNTLGSNELSTS